LIVLPSSKANDVDFFGSFAAPEYGLCKDTRSGKPDPFRDRAVLFEVLVLKLISLFFLGLCEAPGNAT